MIYLLARWAVFTRNQILKPCPKNVWSLQVLARLIRRTWAGILARNRKRSLRCPSHPAISAEQQPASKIAAEIINFDPSKYMEPKAVKRTDRFIQFAIAASKFAAADAQLDMDKEDPLRVGVVAGSVRWRFPNYRRAVSHSLGKRNRCSPMTVPMLIVNMAAGWLSIIHKAKGPNLCTVTACATSSNSLGDAYRLIERGEADVMFAGGSEAPITPLVIGRLLLSSYPFNKKR